MLFDLWPHILQHYNILVFRLDLKSIAGVLNVKPVQVIMR